MCLMLIVNSVINTQDHNYYIKKAKKQQFFQILKILPITTRLSLTGLESSLNLKNTADRPPSHIDTSSTLGKVADTAINLAGHLIAFRRLTIASNT